MGKIARRKCWAYYLERMLLSRTIAKKHKKLLRRPFRRGTRSIIELLVELAGMAILSLCNADIWFAQRQASARRTLRY